MNLRYWGKIKKLLNLLKSPKELDYRKLYTSMKKPACVFDGRRIVDQEKLRKIGFRVFVIGSASNQALNFFP
jgi:hypothetical protein